jgi:hypothetical protein
MSHLLTIEVDDETFQAVRQHAEAAGVPPARWVAESLERHLPRMSPPVASGPAGSAARNRFEQLIGSVDLGHPTDLDNESIDADLCREYVANHESD